MPEDQPMPEVEVDIDIHISISSSSLYPGYVTVAIGEGYYGKQITSMFAEGDDANIQLFIMEGVPQAIKLAYVKAQAEREQEARELREAGL